MVVSTEMMFKSSFMKVHPLTEQFRRDQTFCNQNEWTQQTESLYFQSYCY
jgi:hypothetical protein